MTRRAAVVPLAVWAALAWVPAAARAARCAATRTCIHLIAGVADYTDFATAVTDGAAVTAAERDVAASCDVEALRASAPQDDAVAAALDVFTTPYAFDRQAQGQDDTSREPVDAEALRSATSTLLTACATHVGLAPLAGGRHTGWRPLDGGFVIARPRPPSHPPRAPPLQPFAVRVPPGGVCGGQVVVARTEADLAVDEAPDDVGVPGVAVGLGDHVHEDPVQRHLVAVLRPPGHVPDRIEVERRDRGVGVGPGPVVEIDDVGT